MKRIADILVLLLLVFSYEAKGQNIYLLSVGIADYPGERNDLRLATADAKALYDLFLSNGRVNASILTNSNATKENIVAEAKRVFKGANQNDIVVFFFSGHGTGGGFCAYDRILKYSDIRKVFSECKASNKIIFADACLSGKIRQAGKEAPNSLKNILLFLSSRHNEVSYEIPGMKNSCFTSCLVRSLKGGADADRDKIITAKELFLAVSSGVKKISNNKQHPVMWGNFEDQMPVMVW